MFDSEASSFKFDLVTIIVFICLLQLLTVLLSLKHDYRVTIFITF